MSSISLRDQSDVDQLPKRRRGGCKKLNARSSVEVGRQAGAMAAGPETGSRATPG